jgi:hypothetical protein
MKADEVQGGIQRAQTNDGQGRRSRMRQIVYVTKPSLSSAVV